MKDFVEKHATQLIEIEEMLEETLTDTWDSNSDLISLFIQPYEQTKVVDLIRTENKLYNKVTMAFAALCDEVAFLQETVSVHFFQHHLITITLSHNLTITQSRNHTITLSHNLTISQSHNHNHIISQSHNHTITQSHNHTITLSHTV
jgi:hypothetical protein